MNTMANAYRHGYDAYRRAANAVGRTTAYRNPYPRGTLDCALWNEGYNKAKADARMKYLKAGKIAFESMHGQSATLVIVDEIGMSIDFTSEEGKKMKLDLTPKIGTHTIGVKFFAELQPNAGFRNMRDKVYYYITDHLNDLKVDDYVIVNSPTTGYTCVRVCEVFPHSAPSSPMKYIIDKVDDTYYKERAERAKRRAELEQMLADRARKVEKRQQYAILSQIDPEMKQLFEEYRQLD